MRRALILAYRWGYFYKQVISIVWSVTLIIIIIKIKKKIPFLQGHDHEHFTNVF